MTQTLKPRIYCENTCFPVATALLLHSPRERRSGSLSGLLLQTQRDPEELWLPEQRGGRCCFPSAQLLATWASFALKTSGNAWRQFQCPDQVGSHSLVEARDVAKSPTRQPNNKEGSGSRCSLEPGFRDPGPAGDGGGMRAARDQGEKAHRFPGQRNTKSALSLLRGAAGVGTLTCAKKSPHDSFCPSGLWGAKWERLNQAMGPCPGTYRSETKRAHPQHPLYFLGFRY